MAKRRFTGLSRVVEAVLSGTVLIAAYAAQAAVEWPMDVLRTPPKVYEAPQYSTNGIRALFFDGLPYKGRPTRVFAYCGIPEHRPGVKLPAMVLVHGGAGSAFVRWVKFWNSKGYAAISMDTCGKISGNTKGNEQFGHYPHAWSGPPGWGGFTTVDDPDEDHWMFHAVAAVVRANSLMRSLPEVDPDRIGLTGVSWGGIISSLVASIDDRFRFAAPVYGCGGNFVLSPAWQVNCGMLGEEGVKRWMSKWDPISYLQRCKVPIRWINGTNDPWFAIPAIERCIDTVADGSSTLKVRMVHTHGRVSEQAAEIVAMAAHHLNGGPALPRFGEVREENGVVRARFTADPGLVPVRAKLDYTKDAPDPDGLWYSRVWSEAPAEISGGVVSARLPEGAKAFYLNLETVDGVRTSSRVVSGKDEAPLRGARWLCPQQLVHATNTVVEFVSEFDSGAEVPVSFAVSADTAYAAELNGRMFHCGSFPDTPPRRFYDLMPAGCLRKGKNELKVKLYIEGIDTFRHIPGDPGVMFSLFGDGVHVKSGTSTRWRVSAQDRIEGVACVTRQLGFSFDHDASAAENQWRDITDADARRDDRDFILGPRPVPKTEILGPIESRIVAQGVLDGSPTSDCPATGMDETRMTPVGRDGFFHDDARSVRREMFGKGFYVTVDLGREEAGHLVMDLDTDEGVTVDIGHAEHMKDGRITVRMGNRRFAGRYRTKEGRQSFFRWRQRMAGRYIQIHVRGVRTRFRLERLTVCPAMLPLAEKPAPEGLDPLQKRIWDVSVRTLRLCAHEHYEDCPWREQALYANDSRNQMLAGYHAFGADNRMPELSMELMARGLGDDGWMELCMPARIPITIPSFTFSWVLSVDDHFKYRKNKAFTRAMMPVVKRILNRRLREMKDGLLPDPAGKRYWHFYEWAEDLDGGDVCGFTVKPGAKCFDSPLNLLFLLALEAGARCDEAVGDKSHARLWRSVAGRLRTEIRRRFWNVGKRRMETRLGADLKPAELVQALALLADAIPPEDKAFVAERLASGSDWTETTISQALYKFEALAAFGGEPAKSIIPKISSEWGAMLEKGATSFWEMREGASAFHDAGSLCHGWSAIPAYIYGAYPELRKGDADRTRCR